MHLSIINRKMVGQCQFEIMNLQITVSLYWGGSVLPFSDFFIAAILKIKICLYRSFKTTIPKELGCCVHKNILYYVAYMMHYSKALQI